MAAFDLITTAARAHPIVFCEMHPPDDFPLLFYPEPKAPDMNADDFPTMSEIDEVLHG